jgi:uncharacterized membrane protein
MCGMAYTILQTTLLRVPVGNPVLARAIGKDAKGKISVLLYATAIAASFWNPLISYAIYVLTALMWLVPDRRIERQLEGFRD